MCLFLNVNIWRLEFHSHVYWLSVYYGRDNKLQIQILLMGVKHSSKDNRFVSTELLSSPETFTLVLSLAEFNSHTQLFHINACEGCCAVLHTTPPYKECIIVFEQLCHSHCVALFLLTASTSLEMVVISWTLALSSSLCLSTTSFSFSITSRSCRWTRSTHEHTHTHTHTHIHTQMVR